jgi:hypothetical protein
MIQFRYQELELLLHCICTFSYVRKVAYSTHLKTPTPPTHIRKHASTQARNYAPSPTHTHTHTYTHTHKTCHFLLAKRGFSFFRSLQKNRFLHSKRLTAHFLGIPFQVLSVLQNAFLLPRVWKVTTEGVFSCYSRRCETLLLGLHCRALAKELHPQRGQSERRSHS